MYLGFPPKKGNLKMVLKEGKSSILKNRRGIKAFIAILVGERH
jgi:hypothetical protein